MENSVTVVEDGLGDAISFFEEFWMEIVTFFSPHILVPRIVISIVIVIVALVIRKIIVRMIKKAASRSKKMTPVMASLMRKTISALITLFAAIAVIQTFGINLTPILAGLGITGVILGFALQETISSFFSGVLLAVNNPFRIGDYVLIDTVEGTVVAIDLMCVTLATSDNKKITMNNKTVWASTITNYSDVDKRRVDLTVSIAYSSDMSKVRPLIYSLLRSYPEVLPDPDITIEVSSINDSALNLIVRPWTKPDDYWAVLWRFYGEIIPLLNNNGIEVVYKKVNVDVISSPGQ